MSRLGLGEPGGTLPPNVPAHSRSSGSGACSRGSHWFPLRFNLGRPLRFAPWPAVGCCRSGAELLPVITWLSTTFLGCCPYVVTGLSSAVIVGSWLPRGGGYGLAAVVRTLARDGSVGLAARHPAMTRPLIERRDMIAG
ncbi:hypothetical protein DBZ45_10585 [Arthrobacter globiformis]|uniref:Uncharacterized protein n=1 Tax=Arthrobacter globiformis TaxID=1665 RepID=A0A328HJS4_ARTGO|nr:hypothetical protein DBZ45_10585 [Arthrobacter globiformis]